MRCGGRGWVPGSLACALLVGCGRSSGLPSSPGPLRLIDRFDRARLVSPAPPPEAPARVELRFDGTGTPPAFTAGPAISDLAVREGRLVGRTTGKGAVLLLEVPERAGVGDRLHAVEVRARVSAGRDLSLRLEGAPEVDLAAAAKEAARAPFNFHTPLVPGDEPRLYTMSVATTFIGANQPLPASIRAIVVNPSDEAGAEFALESVRLVYRREHLAAVPSGPSWQGLGEVWRETLVARSPETLSFLLELPERPWLDLAVGTPEEGPVTFRVDIEADGRRVELARRTVSTPERWEELPVDLHAFGGRTVELFLTAEGEGEGRIGFWGAPVVRHRILPESAPGGPRGVVLVVADTLRRDRLPFYGHQRPNAPVLSRLAEEGVVFEDGISPAPWTKVAVTSLLSGLLPSSHRVADQDDRLSAAATPLAEVFRAAGYATWASASVPFTGQLTNLHQGVEVLHERASLQLPDGVSRSKTARVLVDRLLPWLEAHRDSPFFVVLHVFDPHSPFAPYAPYDALWADPAGRVGFERDMEAVRKVIEDPFLRGQVMPTRGELEKAGVDPAAYVAYELDWYDGSIRAMDVEIGRLVEALERLGLARDTLLAFVGDHGEEFLEHGAHWHGDTVYGEMTNVPFLLWWPAGLAAGRRPETVGTIDLAPTLVQLAGLPVPDSYAGQSLVPLLLPENGGRWQPRPVLSELWLSPEDARHRTPREWDSFSLVADGWRLVHYTVRPPEKPEYELYDHRADPLNLHDVASEHPEVVTRLAAQLAQLREWAEARQLDPAAAGEGMSAVDLEQLRSLGYVQ